MCIYVFECVSISIGVYVFKCLYLYMYLSVCIYICMYIYIWVSVYACIFIKCMCKYMDGCVSLYVLMCENINVFFAYGYATFI